MSNANDIEVLIRLLDDPDKHVFEAVKGKLSTIGLSAIPQLEDAWENSLDSLFQTRIENIIQDIHHAFIKDELNNWMSEGAKDLLKGAALICKFQYPDVNIESLYEKVSSLKKDIWLELNEHLTALEKVKIMNHILFEIHGFARSSTFQNNAQVNFLNHVLDTKKGSPISLAILYASIAQELNIPVYGVALAKNFILCYKDEQGPVLGSEFEPGVLFYINPFNKGIVFGKREIEQFIKQQKLEKKDAYFQACTNLETVRNLVFSLIAFHQENGDHNKVEKYQELLNILYY